MNNEHEKVAVPEGEIKNRQQKDAELDKKIQALKKKNEALIKRYKEIEEDRKNSETVSIAASSRRQKPDSLTITIMKAPNEKRVVNECFRDLSDSEDDAEQRFSFRMGNKVELAVTMDSYNKQGKKIAMKKMDQDCGHPEREPCILTKEQTDDLFTFGRGRRMQIAITMEKELTKRNQQKKRIDCNKEENKKSENGSLKDSDATLAATVREQIEYIRWKKEREQIDQERLARQKNSKGEWRRLWDAEKTLNMFHDTPAYSGRNHDGYCGKRGGKKYLELDKQDGTESKGNGKQILLHNEQLSKRLPAKSSNAKGKDRLTGRAQRWNRAEDVRSVHMYEDPSMLLQEMSECQNNDQCMRSASTTEMHTGSEQPLKEDNHTLENAAIHKRQSTDKEKTASISSHGFDISNSDVVTCLETLPGKLPEGLVVESKLHFCFQDEPLAKKENKGSIPYEGRKMGDYLSVLKSKRAQVVGQTNGKDEKAPPMAKQAT